MKNKLKPKKLSPEQLLYTLDLIDHHDHIEPGAHDDDHCCGSCKNFGNCSSKSEVKDQKISTEAEKELTKD